MSDTTITPADEIATIDRDLARTLGLAAYGQLLDLLERLQPEHWDRRTDCDRWDVAAMVGHVIGAAKSNASLVELARQQLRGRRNAHLFDGCVLDATNEGQVEDHADLSPRERIDLLASLAQKAVTRRTSLPAPLRAIPIPLDTTGSMAPGLPERITFGHLNHVIYLRDTWLHAVDIEAATGVAVPRTRELDAIVVADAVAAWMAGHGQPVTLELQGPAGGAWRQGHGGPTISLDAVTWARTVSHRIPGDGLLASPVLF